MYENGFIFSYCCNSAENIRKGMRFSQDIDQSLFFNDGQFFNTFRQFFVYMSMKILNITAFLNTINKTLLGFAFRFQWFFIAYWYKLDSPSRIPKLQTNNNGPRTVQVCVSVLLRFVLRCVLFSDIIRVFFFVLCYCFAMRFASLSLIVFRLITFPKFKRSNVIVIMLL